MRGVYKIQNKINGKFYIGSSVNVLKRLKQQMTNLKGGYGENYNLQSEVNIYGIKNFTFDIMETTTGDHKSLEQSYINNLKPQYNIYPNANSPLGYKHSESTKSKIGISNRKKKTTTKITEGDILKIRDMYSTGLYKQKDIAKVFNTNQGYISHIVNKNKRNYIG